jgi:wyosine [tRNA(Phe)-imidazoG37] synthetase (radical SAM superfamily)
VFCQLGSGNTTVDRREYMPTADVIAELDHWLARSHAADYITLSGSGEPTLHSRFGEIISHVRANARIPTALLSNGTTMHIPAVRKAAARADLVKVSLSAWDQESFQRINRPNAGLDFDKLVAGETALRSEFPGSLWMEVFVIAGINSTPEAAARIAEVAAGIRPDRIQLNTAVRPPAEPSVGTVPEEVLLDLARLFTPPAEVIAGFPGSGIPGTGGQADGIMAVLNRRPCTITQLGEASGLHVNAVSKLVAELLRAGRIQTEPRDGQTYYVAVRRRESGGSPEGRGTAPCEDIRGPGETS